MSTVTDVVALLRASHDEACADYSAAQRALADADARRRALEVALVALEPLTGEEVAAAPLPVVDLLARTSGSLTKVSSTMVAVPAASKPAKKARAEAPVKQPSRQGQRPGKSKHNLALVAALARDAITEGRPLHTIAGPLGVSKAMANFLVQQARAAGHDIPRVRGAKTSGGAAVPPAAAPPEPTPVVDEPVASDDDVATVAAITSPPPATWTPKPGENVVCCDDCDTIYPSMSRFRLAAHIRSEHHREPSRAEMLPTAWAGVA